MIISGFALEKVSTKTDLEWWGSVPGTVRVPGEKITVDAASVGWEFGDYRIVARDKEFPDPIPPRPAPVSDRQFAHALWLKGIITHEEAMDFVKIGTIPAALDQVISGIEDETQRKSAELLVAGATIFERDHPVTEALRSALAMTSEETDALWQEASAL